MEGKYKEYPVFKGVQKPLIFMGLAGRYIAWAAAGALGCFLLFAISFAVFGLGAGILALALGLSSTMGLISYRQKKGLHTKRIMEGVHVAHLVFLIR